MKKGDVRFLYLLFPGIQRVERGFKHTGKPVFARNFLCDAGKRVVLPCFRFLLRPHGGLVGNGPGLDGRFCGRAAPVHGVDFKNATVKHTVFPVGFPILLNDDGGDFHAL